MTPLEISTAAMSANSGSLIIVCAVASAVILIVSFLHERLKAFNAKHSIITYSDTLVRPVSWNGGRDGVDADGVPFYGSFEEEDSDAASISASSSFLFTKLPTSTLMVLILPPVCGAMLFTAKACTDDEYISV